MNNPEELDLATRLARVFDNQWGAVAPPIVQSSLFSFDDYQSFLGRMGDAQGAHPVYSRADNPTVKLFESLMAEAEWGEDAVGFASGMGAISASLVAFMRPGAKIICVENVYPDTFRFLETVAKTFGVEVEYHSTERFEEDETIYKGVQIAYLESPTSLVFQTLNLARVAEHAKAAGCKTIIDNSWATPVFQNPLRLGIDIVVHSASKYISGHSDTVAGVVVGSREDMHLIRTYSLALFGAKLGPFEAWLLIRGMRTLVLRMRQHEANTAYFVGKLAENLHVTKINAPGANTTLGLRGSSGLISFELDDSIDIENFTNALKHFRIGVSWGGYESLVLPAQATLSQKGEYNSARKFGVSPRLVRISLGLEDASDLWRDFERALDSAESQ